MLGAVFFVHCHFCITRNRGFRIHERRLNFRYHNVRKSVIKQIRKSVFNRYLS